MRDDDPVLLIEQLREMLKHQEKMTRNALDELECTKDVLDNTKDKLDDAESKLKTDQEAILVRIFEEADSWGHGEIFEQIIDTLGIPTWNKEYEAVTTVKVHVRFKVTARGQEAARKAAMEELSTLRGLGWFTVKDLGSIEIIQSSFDPKIFLQ